MIKFKCPKTNRQLARKNDKLVYEDDGQIAYDIIDGIPRFVELDNYAAAFGLQWKKFAKTQLDSFTNTTISEDRLKLTFGNDLTVLKGKTILEAGSGAGRFTEVLLKYGAIVYTFDFSVAVEANQLNNGSHPNFTICQADIRHIPFPENAFDYVLCIGVIQHTPDTWESISSLYKYVKPGGELLVDHYIPQLSLYTSLYLVYWYFIRRMPIDKQARVTDALTAWWFPIHWRFKESRLTQMILHRITPINFYYPQFPLTKELHYEWSRLDTHDRNTDHFKRHIRIKDIGAFLTKLGGVNVTAGVRRPGVATCFKGN